MTKIQFNVRQYTVTISEDNIKRMRWQKGTTVYIAKDPERDMLYVEEIKSSTRTNTNLKNKQ